MQMKDTREVGIWLAMVAVVNINMTCDIRCKKKLVK